MLDPYIASHRFGLSETSVQSFADDPQGWVLEQVHRPAPMADSGLMPGHTAWVLTRDVMRTANTAAGKSATNAQPPGRSELRRAAVRALAARWNHAIATDTPVAERWTWFWANHFCVSGTRGPVAPLVWPFEREAIRPHVWGRFADLARAATLHPAMLIYLDNAQSIGPQSPAGKRRERGLNENLARELLELHTLGVNGGYTQADVTETARLLTGWTLPPDGDGNTQFVPRVHQPGSKRVLGQTHPEGPTAIGALLTHLARQPATARHLATKLVRHFVTDQPPAPLVAAVEKRFLNTDGDLTQTALALFGHPLAWDERHSPKFKTPEELVISVHRVLKRPIDNPDPSVVALTDMGQPPGRAPSPQGWPDLSSDWLSPQSLMQRVKWADRFARQNATLGDARAVAQMGWGSSLSNTTRTEIERADSGAQAMALWLASPEFQRR
jgi:uncharacterized protein (DUF1800 family)